MNYKTICQECNGQGEFYSFTCDPAVWKCTACDGKGYFEDYCGKTYFPNCS